MRITAEIIRSLENLDEELFNVTVHFIKGMEDGALTLAFMAESLDWHNLSSHFYASMCSSKKLHVHLLKMRLSWSVSEINGSTYSST